VARYLTPGETFNDHVNVMGCLHDPANVQQTGSKCIQNTRANAGRLPHRVNTLLMFAKFATGDKVNRPT